MKPLKLIAFSAILLAIATLLFYSCKKSSKEQTSDWVKERTDLREQYRQKLKDQPTTSIEILNQKGKGYYGDISGNPLSLATMKQFKLDGSSCPDPSDTEAEQVFYSMEREFTCGVGYRFVVTYKVTSEFYPIFGSGATISGGHVRLKNSGGTVIFTSPFAALITIQNNGVVGTNSNGDDLNEFLVTFRTDFVSESIYSNATSIQPNALIYTDCLQIATINILYSTQQSTLGSQHITQPCLRIDRVTWNPSGGGAPPNLSGADPTGFSCFPTGYIYPYRQQVQFQNGSGVWKPFYLYLNGLANASTQTDLIQYTDVWYIDVSTSQSLNGLVPGDIQVRFRNNLLGSMSNGGPCVTQPADTWITQTWHIN